MVKLQEYSEMSPAEVANNHELRSRFLQRLVSQIDTETTHAKDNQMIPRVLVQFWDDTNAIPSDVQECIDSWNIVESLGIKRVIFNDALATQFIRDWFTERHVNAFARCAHPAMRADYFRLCYILKSGGFYVDADDVFQGTNVDHLFLNGRLKMQPLCYDIITDSMVDPVQYARDEREGRIFYVNNNPLIAPAGHPVVDKALERATVSLLEATENDRDIQSLTGPGNLTACLVEYVLEQEQSMHLPDFELLSNWGAIATSKWPLSYRSDQRNWRNWARDVKHVTSATPEEVPE